MKNEYILILDFGGQYNQLIARRVRECNVYCEVKPYTLAIDEIKKLSPKGIIFTGGPNSVYDEKSPHISKEIFELGVPVLGICYGCQIMAYTLGGTVTSANSKSEYGKTEISLDNTSKLFKGIENNQVCWMSHTDYVSEVPEGFKVTASSSTCPTAAMECEDKNFYAVQFHPEVNHTPKGKDMLKNFLFEVCGCTGDWVMANYIHRSTSRSFPGHIAWSYGVCVYG